MQKHSSSENWITKVDVVDEFDFPDFILDFVAGCQGGAFFAILSRPSLTLIKRCTLLIFNFTSRYERNFNSFKFRHLTPILNNEENNNKCFFSSIRKLRYFESLYLSKLVLAAGHFGVFETRGYATIAINTICFLESLRFTVCFDLTFSTSLCLSFSLDIFIFWDFLSHLNISH